MHVRGEPDYRFICDMRDEFFEQTKACFFHLQNDNVPVYGVPGALKEHCTSKKNAQAGQDKIPPEGYRIRTEDLYESLTEQSS